MSDDDCYLQTKQMVDCLREAHVDIEIIKDTVSIRLGRVVQPLSTWQCAYWYCVALDSSRYYFKDHIDQLYPNPKSSQPSFDAEIMRWRKHLWLSHGCRPNALYGDDGEMQCLHCRIDFKRMSLDTMEEIWHGRAQEQSVKEPSFDAALEKAIKEYTRWPTNTSHVEGYRDGFRAGWDAKGGNKQ